MRYVEVPVPTPAPVDRPLVECPEPGPESPPPQTVGPDQRRVVFVAHPAGAEVELDGAPIAWFGTHHVLSVGAHELRARVPASTCCDPVVTTVDVLPPPDQDRDDVQRIRIALPLRDAEALLVGAPPGHYVACDNGLVVRGADPKSVAMENVAWTGSCTFLPGGRQTTITLRAGATTTIIWSPP